MSLFSTERTCCKYCGRKNGHGVCEDYLVDEFYQLKETKFMSGIGALSWVNVKSAFVYGLVAGFVAVAMYALSVGDLFALSWHTVINGFVFGFLTSVIKNFLTTDAGNFAGVIKTVDSMN